MKKLYLISSISFIAFWIVVGIANFLLSNYYETDFIRDNDWAEVFLTFLALTIFAFLISVVFYRKRPILRKFLISFSAICSVVTIFLSIYWLVTLFTINENRNQLKNEFRTDAERDIKNDAVKIFSQGLAFPPKDELIQIEEDSIQKIFKKYGLTRQNIGCTIYPELEEAKEEYRKITNVYLDKRNGKNWNAKMQSEINEVRNHR